MKFRLQRQEFAEAVAWTARSIPTRLPVPVLAGLLLQARDGQLQLSGFDYEVSTRCDLDIQLFEEGSAVVAGRLLAEITKALPAKPVDVELVGDSVELTCGGAQFTLPTLPLEDYPRLPPMPELAGTIKAAEFATAVNRVTHRRRPGRDAADAHRRAGRDGRRPDHHVGHRPLPAGDDRAGLAARASRRRDERADPGQGAVGHRPGAGRRRRRRAAAPGPGAPATRRWSGWARSRARPPRGSCPGPTRTSGRSSRPVTTAG